MTEEKTAILVDSCSDVPEELRRKYGMYVVPMTNIYQDGEYRDGVDIRTDDVDARFPQEIPSTSLPNPSVVAEVFKQIKADGSIFDLKPVISCNEDGVYCTVAKTRGRKKSLQLALQKAVEHAEGANEYNVAVMHGAAKPEADEILAALKAQLPDFHLVIEGQITPVLVVRTGPGLIGIGIQRLA